MCRDEMQLLWPRHSALTAVFSQTLTIASSPPEIISLQSHENLATLRMPPPISVVKRETRVILLARSHSRAIFSNMTSLAMQAMTRSADFPHSRKPTSSEPVSSSTRGTVS